MNNNNYSLVRYLRAKGYNAQLFSLNEADHFHPQHDTFDLDYQHYFHELTWSQGNFDDVSKTEIQERLKGFQFIIAEGVAMAFLEKGGFKVDIFIPYGYDLYELPFWAPSTYWKSRILQLLMRFLRKDKKLRVRKDFTLHHRKSIENCGYILCGNKELEGPINALSSLAKWKRISAPIVNNLVYNPQKIKEYYDSSYWLKTVLGHVEACDLVILSHVRHFWKPTRNANIDYYSFKANDRLIKAFARVSNLNPEKTTKLILLEYGPHVKDSKALITELKIEDKVLWLPKSSRKELMICMSQVDLVAGEFNLSSLGSGVANEAMVMGKPLLGYRDDKLYTDEFPELYPLLNASSEDEIYEQLSFAISNPSQLKIIGKKASLWYQKYVVDASLNFIEALIQNRSQEYEA